MPTNVGMNVDVGAVGTDVEIADVNVGTAGAGLGTANVQTNRIGDRLIAAGLIDRAQCARALAYQAENGGLLGNALVQLGYLSREQLDEFFSAGQYAWSGEQMLQAKLINRSQLAEALNYQLENGGRLGNALVALGHVSQQAIDEFFHQKQMKPSRGGGTERLGERLVREGVLSREDLERALQLQRNSGGQLGEALLVMGFVTPEQLYRTIATQQNVGRVGSKLDLNDARKLPYPVALKHSAIIINTREHDYVLAVSHILDEAAVTEITAYLDKPVEQVLATMGEIETFWEMAYQYDESESSVYRLYDEQPMNSAIVTISRGQKMVGILLLSVFCLLFVLDHPATLLTLNIGIQILYLVFTLLKVTILARGFTHRDHLKYTKEEVDAIDERELPVYTILLPVYKEAAIVERLVNRLNSLDYPKHKLDIRILLEEDDHETIAALKNMDCPFYFTLLVVPDTQPRTKPKACNYGLLRARGDYVVIYDAEDIPDPDQLKKAYLAFRDLPDSYVCVQSKLNYFNSSQNLLTQWFTQEYSTWFDILLIGTMTLDSPIPLGGTSNHFKADFLRRIGAWDPFNVTEDADLGVRLYKMDYKTAVLDSYTWEEANSHVKNWIRQRSRWIKGYLQTWLVHMRRPVQLFKDLGLRGFIGYQAMILGTPLLPILNPLFWALVLVWYLFKPALMYQLFPGSIYYIAAVQLWLGNFIFIYTNLIGTYTVIRGSEERGNMHIGYPVVFSGILLFLYWFLMSIAAYKALFQLFFNPFYWEKTTHGLSSQVGLKSVSEQEPGGGS